MRIIAGEKKGFRLKTPAGQKTRPTLGRVRESLFMRLMPWLSGAVVLDLFAGSGGLGLEALSRGAAAATFVETSRPALSALRDNVARLGWSGRVRVVEKDALRWLRGVAPPGERWGLVLLDPPYGQAMAAAALEVLGERAGEILLAGDAIVVAQVGRRDELGEAYGALRLESEQSYGETRVAIYRRAGTEVQAG
jgi:16S rRNA (guanine966-N2)-methyltransferase